MVITLLLLIFTYMTLKQSSRFCFHDITSTAAKGWRIVSVLFVCFSVAKYPITHRAYSDEIFGHDLANGAIRLDCGKDMETGKYCGLFSLFIEILKAIRIIYSICICKSSSVNLSYSQFKNQLFYVIERTLVWIGSFALYVCAWLSFN